MQKNLGEILVSVSKTFEFFFFLLISSPEYVADFYDVCNLYRLVYRYKGEEQIDRILHMACDQFSKMVCQIYEGSDYGFHLAKGSIKFKILDFSTFPPKSGGTFMLPGKFTHSICCTRKPDSLKWTKQAPYNFLQSKDSSPPVCLLIATCGTSGVAAYILESKKIHWGVTGGCFRGMKEEMCDEAITTDGDKHLFVVDSANRCIHIFTLDGFHVSILVKQGLLGVGNPRHVAWCSATSSLVIAHDNDDAKNPMSKISILSLK